VRRRRVLPSLFLAAATAVVILAFTAFQASGPTAGPRLLGRLAAAMIELDRWLPAHMDDIQSALRDRPRVVVEVPGLPLSAPVPGPALLDDGGAALKAALIESMGAALYQNGAGAFQGGGGLSLTEPARWTIELLGRDARRAFEALVLAGGAVELVFMTLVVTTAAGPLARRFLLPIGFGGAAALLAGLALWLLARLGAGAVHGAVDREVLLILRDCSWIGVRDGFATALAAAAVLALVRLAAPAAPEQEPWPAALDEPA